jgi:hypothetical protein
MRVGSEEKTPLFGHNNDGAIQKVSEWADVMEADLSFHSFQIPVVHSECPWDWLSDLFFFLENVLSSSHRQQQQLNNTKYSTENTALYMRGTVSGAAARGLPKARA